MTDEVDPDVAEGLAREHLAEALDDRWGPRSEVARLCDHTTAIAAPIEAGDVPKKNDLREARAALRAIEKRLDDVAALFGWSKWETGAALGELPDEELDELEAAEECEA